MLSNSCKYGIRAVIYIASRQEGDRKTGIQQISRDLDLPTPYLAKILQILAKKKLLKSLKGPHGGFSLLKAPAEISIYDIVNIIDGEEIFTNCIIHDTTCKNADRQKIPCPLHEDYSKIRADLIQFFKTVTVEEMVKKTRNSKKIAI